jgi:hypothetical protein
MTETKLPEVQMSLDKVSAGYMTNAGQTIYGNDVVNIINFEDVEWDTHSAVTIGADWKFVAPIAGYYHVDVHCLSNAFSWVAGDIFYMTIKKNGSPVHWPCRSTIEALIGEFKDLGGACIVPLAVGDYIQIGVHKYLNTNTSLFASGLQNFCHIFKL